MNTTAGHMTNPEFAAAVGVTRSMASRLRSGDRRPSTRVAHRILEALCPADRHSEGLAAFADSGVRQAAFLESLVGPAVVDQPE